MTNIAGLLFIRIFLPLFPTLCQLSIPTAERQAIFMPGAFPQPYSSQIDFRSSPTSTFSTSAAGWADLPVTLRSGFTAL